MSRKARERYILDTNVQLQGMVAILAPLQVPVNFLRDRQVVEHVLAKGQLCITEYTWAEFKRNAADLPSLTKLGMSGKPPSPTQCMAYLEQLRQKALLVEPVATHERCEDRGDQMLLHAASGARARYIITHDHALLAVKKVGEACEIIPPRVLLARLAGKPVAVNQRDLKQALRP